MHGPASRTLWSSLVRPSKTRLSLLPIVLVLGSLTSVPALHADVTVLQASKDNTLFEDTNGLLSNGAGEFSFSGHTNSNDTIRRALIAFDIAGQIPVGSTINSVTLALYLSRVKNGTYDFSLFKVSADWGEAGSNSTVDGGGQGAPAQAGDATWLHQFYPSTFWATPGGDFSGTASATTTVPNTLGTYTWSSAGMVADVQGWLDNPGTNFGWVVSSASAEAVKRTARRFDTRENSVFGQRPTLTVDYTPAAVSGACCLPDDSCTILTPAECANQGGSYQGDGTSCSPNPCVVPTGACCFDDGTCADTTEAVCISLGGTYQGDATACSTSTCPIILEAFVDSLVIPPLATPISGSPGATASYEIAIQEFTQKLHRDLPPTRLWGYDGIYPGPTILAGRNQPVSVAWINDLRDSTGALRTDHYLPVELCIHGPDHNGDGAFVVTHLHGGHVPAAVDGHPDSLFAPGEQRTYVYPNNQQAATLWYHDHALGITRLNVMMGVAGAYVVTDSVEGTIDLPSGGYDVPLIIQDRSFNSDGTLSYPESFQEHFFGDKILVNGVVWPYMNVEQGKYRFRMLNGCNSRFLTLSLSNGAPLTIVGNDGGLLSGPVNRDSLTISPGERYEVVIDFGAYPPGTEIILQNSAPIRYPGTPGDGVIPEVMKFIVQDQAGHTNPIPASLRPVPAIPESLAVQSRDFLLAKEADPCAGSKWTINGLGWFDITEQVELGSTEVWRFVNRSGVSHPMHIHLVMYQILNRETFTMVGDSIVVTGTMPPDSSEAGWKDTSPVGPDETIRVIATFDDYPGTFVYHCHILEHEDHEMMRQFQVIASPTGVPDVAEVSPLIRVQNHPNPFGSSTSITFTLSRKAPVTLRIYDLAGRLVRDLIDTDLEGREHSVVWDGRDGSGRSVGAGIYFLKLVADRESLTRKMVLVR